MDIFELAAEVPKKTDSIWEDHIPISKNGREIKAHDSFIDKHMPMIFKKMYAGFLTNKEIEDMIEGKDIWLNGDEVLERFEAAKLGVYDDEK